MGSEPNCSNTRCVNGLCETYIGWVPCVVCGGPKSNTPPESQPLDLDALAAIVGGWNHKTDCQLLQQATEGTELGCPHCAAIVAAVNACPTLIERCKRAERTKKIQQLESENDLANIGKLLSQVADLTRQRDELLAAVQAVIELDSDDAMEWVRTSDYVRSVYASVKGGADGA